MDENILKQLKNVELEMLSVVHNICKDNKLKYYLIAGSLLGAVRHQGFIPWDDDIDIAMPRKDYEKLIQLCQEGALGEKYALDNILTNDNYFLSFTKIRKNNTLFEEAINKDIECNKGIFIDIFPLDYIKKNKGKVYHIKAKTLKNLAHIVMVRVLGVNTVSMVNKVLYIITKPFSIKMIWGIYNIIAKSCKNGDYYINYGSWYSYIKETIPKEYFGEGVLLDFERQKFYAPKEYDLILKRIFNNYMELPSEKERRNHNPAKVIFDTRKEG